MYALRSTVLFSLVIFIADAQNNKRIYSIRHEYFVQKSTTSHYNVQHNYTQTHTQFVQYQLLVIKVYANKNEPTYTLAVIS